MSINIPKQFKMFTANPMRKLLPFRQDVYLYNNLSKADKYVIFGMSRYGKNRLRRKMEYVYKHIKLKYGTTDINLIMHAPIKERYRWAKDVARRNDGFMTSDVIKEFIGELLRDLYSGIKLDMSSSAEDVLKASPEERRKWVDEMIKRSNEIVGSEGNQ